MKRVRIISNGAIVAVLKSVILPEWNKHWLFEGLYWCFTFIYFKVLRQKNSILGILMT